MGLGKFNITIEKKENKKERPVLLVCMNFFTSLVTQFSIVNTGLVFSAGDYEFESCQYQCFSENLVWL